LVDGCPNAEPGEKALVDEAFLVDETREKLPAL
jgi:hypothetical protein